MIILGIETATIEVGVGLARDGLPLGSLVARPGLRHVETVHPAIEAVIKAAGITLQEIDAIAVDIGPGLFTGLRVGIAAAKALAFGLKVPTIGIRSTDILSKQADLSSLTVIPVIDMRRSEIAWQIPGIDDITLGTPEQLSEQLEQLEDQFLLVGDGARRYAERIVADSYSHLHFGDPVHDAPSVATLVELASMKFSDGETIDPYELTPLYMREADAKVNFAMRDNVVVS